MTVFGKVVLVLVACSAASAQTSPPVVRAAPVDFDKIEIRTTPLADDLHVLEGHGGAITVLSGADGVFMVDTQFAPLTDKLVAAIQKFSDQPIRYVVNTHVHADHTGGNENFAKLGATIYSRDQLRCRLAHPPPGPDGRAPPSAPAKALPVVTYDAPVALHLDNEDVELIPIRAAHTDGDTLVRFPKHDVLAVGDYFRSVQYPFVDVFNGGTLDGILAGLDETVKLAGPRTKIVPGHGPVVDRAAVAAQRDLIVRTRAKVQAFIDKGSSVEQVLAAKPTSDTDASTPQGSETSERFIRWMYSELTRKIPPAPCETRDRQRSSS